MLENNDPSGSTQGITCDNIFNAIIVNSLNI